MKKWYETSSNNSDVVLYSKAVLVRNLENTVFPSKNVRRAEKIGC